MSGHDANHRFPTFGPTNVAIHRVSVAAERGDARGALEAAAHVDPSHLPVALTCLTARVSRSCTLVVCAAPLAHRWPDIAAGLTAAGYTVSVVLTDNAAGWDIPTPPPEQADPRRADAWLVAPLTFNSTAKLALGIADTYAHSVLCEAIGTGARITAVPMITEELFGHPALAGHLRSLRAHGVAFMDPESGTDTVTPVLSGTGADVAVEFDVDALVERVLNRPAWSLSWSSTERQAD